MLSPGQHIASLNAKGHIAVDLTVERGRGYVSADKNKGTGAIGVIPIDSPAKAELVRFVADEKARWSKIVEQVGIAGTE